MTAGAVLCGGASRRMGADKALVDVEGVAMAQRVADALAAAGCDPVVLIGGDRDALARLGRPVVPDRWPGEGPVGGILTALRALTSDTVVAACDLAYLDAATVRRLRAVAQATNPDVVVAHTDRRQPLLAWWSPGAAPAIERQWRDGVRAVHVVVSALVAVDCAVDEDAVRNINTPADLG